MLLQPATNELDCTAQKTSDFVIDPGPSIRHTRVAVCIWCFEDEQKMKSKINQMLTYKCFPMGAQNKDFCYGEQQLGYDVRDMCVYGPSLLYMKYVVIKLN